MFVGGLRALLLQSLHPLAMAGVADHSDFRSDPWGRLQRTAEFLTWTTFGTAEQAERACRRVRAVHSTVKGTAPDGRPYDATDPHLLRWVHLAEMDSFLAAHQRYGTPRLDAAQRDGYVADMARVGEAVGVIDPPRTEAEMRAALGAYRPELRSTKEARDAARFLLLPAPAGRRLRAVCRPGGGGHLVAAVVGPPPAAPARAAGDRDRRSCVPRARRSWRSSAGHWLPPGRSTRSQRPCPAPADTRRRRRCQVALADDDDPLEAEPPAQLHAAPRRAPRPPRPRTRRARPTRPARAAPRPCDRT